jgi:hypothetical protein
MRDDERLFAETSKIIGNGPGFLNKKRAGDLFSGSRSPLWRQL